MPVEEAPHDDDVRQSYNFAPGYHGLVYRAEGRDHGAQKEQGNENAEPLKEQDAGDTKYKLQSMQWGTCSVMFCMLSLIHCRSRAILDEAQPRLWLQDEDDKLP